MSSDNMSSTGVRCNIRSSVLVTSDSMSIVKCHVSGVRYQMSSDNMSSTCVRYQVSGIKCQVITYQVPVSDIKCQGSGVKYNMSSTSVRYQVSCITYQCQIINMLVSGELNTELQHHISNRIAMYHVLKAAVAIVRHVTVITRHPHINISYYKL